MCGACGAASARSAERHWAEPFLASVPARAAAARTLTRWTRLSGWPGTVSAVVSGFEVATASGCRTLTHDLGAVVEQLGINGIDGPRLLAASSSGVVEGPPTHPGPRPRRAGSVPVAVPGGRVDARRDRDCSLLALPPDGRRGHRVPGLLAWLAVADRVAGLAPATALVGLSAAVGIAATVDDDGSITCTAVAAPASDVLTGTDRTTRDRLQALLCPA